MPCFEREMGILLLNYVQVIRDQKLLQLGNYVRIHLSLLGDLNNDYV